MDKVVVSCGNHCVGVAVHERLVRIGEISQHLVTASASNEVDGVGGDVPQ